MLVIGPNRVFLRYIERVLPSLGEAGVEQVVLADLVPDVQFLRRGDDGDDWPAGRARQGRRPHVRRHRPGRRATASGRCATTSWCRSAPATCGSRAEESARIVRPARRRFRRHNAGATFVEGEVWSALAATWRDDEVGPRAVPRGVARHCPRCAPRSSGCGRCSRRRSCSTTCSARRRCCKSGRPRRARRTTSALSLYRPRSENVDDVRWTPPTSPCSTTPARCSVRSSARTARSTSPTRSARTATS